MLPALSIGLFILLTHLVAKYVGEKRYIGYGKTVLLCLLFSPVIGLLVALCSSRTEGAGGKQDRV